MASHASALKAHRQNVVHREHNRQFRSKLRNALRDIRASIDKDDFQTAKTGLKATFDEKTQQVMAGGKVYA